MKHLLDSRVNSKNVHGMVRDFSLERLSVAVTFLLVGNLTEQGKCAYNLLIDRCTSDSSAPSSTPDDQSSSASSNQEKSDYRSQYSSRSSLNSHASSLLKIEQAQHSVTGHPLPPPPDLATLGSKLTTANMTNTFNLPASLISNRHPTKSKCNNRS